MEFWWVLQKTQVGVPDDNRQQPAHASEVDFDAPAWRKRPGPHGQVRIIDTIV